ncbi:uncharacterized protein LOC115880055 [Sitophilus oryzae]|uniref:Uncharacterized protein LOC115880055 n=1 Tax=Sitophilus oryzae TaxID=7048 RepID=A0A6J2XNU1_SITOR|nr:uncharacterized protein LOC115880055 [Sitophilus oryzae]XP_030753037.1 uncharacterized protein LOC115880055 [Sitophilus oryzae]
MFRLPVEIWSLIFKDLWRSDLINFCEAFNELDYLLGENIIKKFDAQGSYKFADVNFVKYMFENVQYHHIRALNINNLYWVPLDDLRNLLSFLPKLEELYALETNLGLKREDVKLYGNLRALAVCVSRNDYNKSDSLDNNLVKDHLCHVQRFCLKFTVEVRHRDLIEVFTNMSALREIWIEEYPSFSVNYREIVRNLKFLDKLVIKMTFALENVDYSIVGMDAVFKCRRFQSMVMYVKCAEEKLVPLGHTSFFPGISLLQLSWNRLSRYQHSVWYDVKAAEKIYMTGNVEDVQFEELNFSYGYACNFDFIFACWGILLTPNSRNLKKLCIKACVFQTNPFLKDDILKETCGRTLNYQLQDIIENCSKLQELELVHCARSCHLSRDVIKADCYTWISQFVHLEKLTVEVPIFDNGEFLIKVIQNCKKLKYLKVISCKMSNSNRGRIEYPPEWGSLSMDTITDTRVLIANDILNWNLSLAIKDAESLEDFFVESKQINLQFLLAGLKEISSCKLRRIHMYGKYKGSLFLPKSDLGIILKKNPQLIYLALEKMIRRNNKYKHNKAKYYYLYQTSELTSYLCCQHIHKNIQTLYKQDVEYVSIRNWLDIGQFDTNVSIIDLADFR